MTTGQSIFIIVLTLANVAGCIWLLWWTRRSAGKSEYRLPAGRAHLH